MKKEGYVRARIDKAVRDLSENIVLDKNKKHTIEIVIDRLVIKEGIEKRLADSLEVALKLSEGIVVISPVEAGAQKTYSTPKSSPAPPAAYPIRR